MIGVAIPVNNEEEWVASCLASVLLAASHIGLAHEEVEIVLVLDSCNDKSEFIVRQYPVTVLSCQARNVGVARAIGAAYLLSAGARWLAFTDADTLVSPCWLIDQLSLQADVVCGTVAVGDLPGHGPHGVWLRAAFQSEYTDADGHRHVHGANLGVSAQAYQQVGGFQPLACSEDQALIDAFVRANISIAWSARPRVLTSGRSTPRARGGFGDYLLGLASMHETDNQGEEI